MSTQCAGFLNRRDTLTTLKQNFWSYQDDLKTLSLFISIWPPNGLMEIMAGFLDGIVQDPW